MRNGGATAATSRRGSPYRLAVKALALLVPPAVVTLTLSRPRVAFAGTLHLMRVLVQETYATHFAAPNLTKLVPRLAQKPVPVIVTIVPRLPTVGESLESSGSTLNPVALRAVPPGVVTAILPLRAEVGTVALI